MEPKDIATIIALILGPVIAVLITLWYQRRQQKRDAKERVFAVLMATRRANPPKFEWANALNLIDIVFQDDRAVVNKWHELYNIVDQPSVNWGQWGHTYIELL